MPELDCPVYRWAQDAPHHPALCTDGHTLTYAELNRYIAGTAERLRALGIGEGDGVAWYGTNAWYHPILLWAILRCKAIACPLNARLPLGTLPDRLRQVSARLLVADLPETKALPIPCVRPGRAIASADTAQEPPLMDLDQRATLVFTSGSTGHPKAVLHTLGNHYFSALGSQHIFPLGPGRRWLVVLPLYHVGGLAICFRCFWHGATVILPKDPRRIQEACTAFGATHLSMVATQAMRLLDTKGTLDALDAILLGGSAIPPSVLRKAHAWGWPVHVSYGSSEMASQVTTTPPGADLETLFTAGHQLPYRAVRRSDTGEILVGGPTRFAGYLEGKHLHRPFDDAGWFATGDRGYWDAYDRLVVQGRIDQMFISGGENIHPEEIEQALCRLENVRQAVVVPVPDPEFGHRPVAFVEAPEDDGKPTDFEQALASHLPRYKIPRTYLPWPSDLPATFKPSRTYFLKRARQTHT